MSAASLVEYRSELAADLVRMWRECFEFGVSVVDPHPMAEQRRYFEDMVLPANTLRIAELDGRMVGFVAATSESVAQLHVRVGVHRRGIGTQLLDWAKDRSGGSLWLYTFQRNAGACAFYESQGFHVTARGFEPHWMLEDVRYEWSRQPQDARC